MSAWRKIAVIKVHGLEYANAGVNEK
jgi:hypothetical protein